MLNETRARDFRIANMVNHIDFNPQNYDNDIAIVRIDRPTLFNTYIWPVCMPPVNEDWTGRNAIVTGWGTQKFGGPHSNILMEVGFRKSTNPKAFLNNLKFSGHPAGVEAVRVSSHPGGACPGHSHVRWTPRGRPGLLPGRQRWSIAGPVAQPALGHHRHCVLGHWLWRAWSSGDLHPGRSLPGLDPGQRGCIGFKQGFFTVRQYIQFTWH